MAEVPFGEWLRRLRKAAGLTQEQLALQISCSVSALRKFEAEERQPSAQTVDRLAALFNVPREQQKAFLRFARGDWSSAPGGTAEEVPWHKPAGSPRSNLPSAASSFIARGPEIALVRGQLARNNVRLLTLVGPPGIGKTRLSIEAARVSLPDFPDGVFFVALAQLNNANQIPQEIARSLGYIGANKRSIAEQLKEGIGDKSMLVVLDNCEHIIDGAASLAADLLSACAQLKILATSRESLRTTGEWLYPVPAFDLPGKTSPTDVETAAKLPALALFAERARAARPDFVLNDGNIETISAICSRLDGLPLVIELIAARIRSMSRRALLERLSGQFILTADGMRAASERQKTLRHAIAWSYDLLPEGEHQLFAYLSVFSGSFTLEAAEVMFARHITGTSISGLVTLLLDKSLLKLVPALEESAETHYAMLVTIQEYARERLQLMGEEREIRNLHLTYFLGLAQKAGREIRGPNQVESLRCLLGMRDNLHAALDWAIESGQTESALQMVQQLHWFWFVHSDHNEARHSFARVLAMPDTSTYPELRAQVLTQLAHHTWTQIGPEEARPFVEEALSIAYTHDDEQNIARALAILGLVLIKAGHIAEAQSNLEKSKTLFQELDDEWEYAHTVICLALAAYRQQDLATSLALHQQALALLRKAGDLYFQSVAQHYIGIVQVRQGDVRRGLAALRESLSLVQQLDSKYGLARVLLRVADAAPYIATHTRAVHLYLAAKNIQDSVGAWQREEELKLENDLAACRAALGEAEFEEAVERGRAMTLEQAIAEALEEPVP